MSTTAIQAGNGNRGAGALPGSSDSVTVRRGDTLSAIAERHGVSLEALLAANPQIRNPDRIFVGDRIELPQAERSVSVQRGDTLAGIAARFGVGLDALIAANPQLRDPDLIFPGELLRLPAAAAATPAAPAPGTPAPAAAPAGRIEPGRLPDTAGLTEGQRFDLYAAQVQQHGDAAVQADLAAGRRVILALRNDTATRINEGRGAYDDRMVVLWRDAAGQGHAVELRANTEPSGQYEPGGPYTRRAIGGDYNGDGRGDQGRLADGSYAFTRGSFLGARALLAGNDQVTERDTNHNGRFDDGVRAARGDYGMHIHIGGQGNTGSAGCLTLPPAEHARLFEALGSQNTVRAVVLNTARLEAAAPAAEAIPAPAPAAGSRTLTEADWQRAAQTLGVDVATIKAVAEVEASRSGFLADGRPKILFEAHQFSERTGGRFDRSHPGISSPRWNRDLYVGGAGEHTRLAEALALDRTAALESASWGRFQIMGFNHEAAGFANVDDFVAAMRQGEGRQLDAFVNFIRADAAMHRALQAHDWAGFAERYNGERYAENQYDTRLADAYRRHAH